jgi:hypothetical protein
VDVDGAGGRHGHNPEERSKSHFGQGSRSKSHFGQGSRFMFIGLFFWSTDLPLLSLHSPSPSPSSLPPSPSSSRP